MEGENINLGIISFWMIFKGMGSDEVTWGVNTEKEGELLILKQNLEFGNKSRNEQRKTEEKWGSQAEE